MGGEETKERFWGMGGIIPPEEFCPTRLPPQSANSFHSINTPAGQASQRPLLPESERPNKEGQAGKRVG